MGRKPMRNVTRAMVVAGLAAVVAVARADDRPKADPPATPLELSISGKTTYTLDTHDLSGAAFRRRIAAAVEDVGPPLAPPAVDLVVGIRNTSDRTVRVWAKGDPVGLELRLSGTGAVNVEPKVFVTAEYRIPEAITLAAGETYLLPVRDLGSGFRGVSRCSYWTEPGEYRLVAILQTGVSPAPRGAGGDDGFGLVTLTSAPLRITVVKPSRGTPTWFADP
jgi:hypothetical protein